MPPKTNRLPPKTSSQFTIQNLQGKRSVPNVLTFPVIIASTKSPVKLPLTNLK